MTKIRALITLVVGKGQELPPGGLYDLSDDEAKRFILRTFCVDNNIVKISQDLALGYFFMRK